MARVGVLTLFLLPAICFAEAPASVPAVQPPAVVLLEVASEPRAALRESRLCDELRLALDGFTVRALAPDDPSFLAEPLFEQIGAVGALASREKAIAVTWLSSPSEHQVFLYLVVVRTGRTMVRSIPATDEPRMEANLALATRELLGEAYLFAPEQARAEPAVTKLVATVRDQVSVPRAAAAPGLWQVSAGFLVAQGLSGYQGPARQIGGSLRLERRVGERLRPALVLCAAIGPDAPGEGGSVDGWEIAPGVGAFYGWRLGGFTLGPEVSLQAGYLRLHATGQAAADLWTSTWKIREVVGLEVRRQLSRAVALWLSSGVGFTQVQDRVQRRSDGATLLATPWNDVRLVMGAQWSLRCREAFPGVVQ